MNNVVKPESIDEKDHIPTFDVEYAINFAYNYAKKGLCLEDLNIQSKNHNKGRNFNKLVNNTWHRKIFIEQLTKRCDISGIVVKQVNPVYSSFIGNLIYKLPDAISSALEIARRGRSGIIYPNLIDKQILANQWKEALEWNYSNWQELYSIFKSKNLIQEYRISMSQKDLVFQKFKRNSSQVMSYINNIFTYYLL